MKNNSPTFTEHLRDISTPMSNKMFGILDKRVFFIHFIVVCFTTRFHAIMIIFEYCAKIKYFLPNYLFTLSSTV